MGPVWRSLGPLLVPGRGPEEGNAGQCRLPPSRPLTLLAFWAAGNVSLGPFSQATGAQTAPAFQAFDLLGGGAPRFQGRTYSLILALEGNVLDDFLITFPWSSVRPWVPRVLPSPLPGSSFVRFVGEEGWVEGQVPVGPLPLL